MYIGQITTDRIDVRQYIDKNLLPSTRVEREGKEVWLVRDEPPDAIKTGASWSFASEGPIAHIPLFPFISVSNEPDGYGHFIFQLAARMAAEAHTIIDKKKIRRLHTAFGYPVEDCGTGFRFWAGLAFLLE